MGVVLGICFYASSCSGSGGGGEGITSTFPESGHSVVVYKDKLWVIGGNNHGDFLADVWFSEDGVTWTEVDIPIDGPVFILLGDMFWMRGLSILGLLVGLK